MLGRIARLRFEDFEWLGRVSSRARTALSRGGACGAQTPMIAFLVWAQGESSTPDRLMAQLEADAELGEGLVQVVSVSRLALRLTTLGFKGNALEVAKKLARFGNGVHVPLDAVRTLLEGGSPRKGGRSPRKPASIGCRGGGQPLEFFR